MSRTATIYTFPVFATFFSNPDGKARAERLLGTRLDHTVLHEDKTGVTLYSVVPFAWYQSPTYITPERAAGLGLI